MSQFELFEARETVKSNWPLAAQSEGLLYVFSQSSREPDLRFDLARVKAGKLIDALFVAVTIAGALALALHFITPVGTMWLRIFFLALFLSTIFWTRWINNERPAQRGKADVDVKQKFSQPALEIFRQALVSKGDRQAHPAHLFLQLIKDKSVQNLLYRLGLGYRQLASALLLSIENLPQTPPTMNEDFARLPFLAHEVSQQVQSERITPPILLAALSRLSKDGEIAQILEDLGVSQDKVFGVVAWSVTLSNLRNSQRRQLKGSSLKPKGEINRSLTSLPTPVLDRFGTDLTLKARSGRLPFAIERYAVLEDVFSTFSSDRTGLLLVGEPGVGKTSVINSLAQRMLVEDVPARLYDKRLVRLEISQILGTPRASEALTAAINDALRGGDIVLVIEDVHEFGQAQSAGVSLLSILSSAIRESGLPVIATTTPTGYQQTPNLQSNSLFERVDIGEMDISEATSVVCVHASLEEGRYRIFWMYPAVEESVKLASRYLQGSKMPAKAIDVIERVSERVGANRTGEVKIISVADVEHVVSEMSHIKLEQVEEGEAEKLLHLESSLHERLIGQDEAVKAVSSAMRRIKARLTGIQSRPLASFLFVGPTGVGKTELTKALAEIEFGSQDSLIRLDMSEYNLPQSIDRLLGGRTHTSAFVSAVRERPYSVILLDEFEKADSQIRNVFLQVMDEGRLTDNAGNTLDLTNALIIATSNAAYTEIKQGFESGTDYMTLHQNLTHTVLPQYFRPELLNRFDDIVLFKPLSIEEMVQIVDLQIKKLGQKLAEQGIEIEASRNGLEAIANAAYDPQFGVRPLRRYLQDTVESQIAELILSGSLTRRDTAVIGDEGQVQVRKARLV